MSLYQVNTDCGGTLPDGSTCDSRYRCLENHRCNLCGKQHAPPRHDDKPLFHAGKKPRGRRWSSKLHRYLKPGEPYP